MPQRKAPGKREGTVGVAEMLLVGGGGSLALTKRSRRFGERRKATMGGWGKTALQ